MKNFIARTTPWNTIQLGAGYWRLNPVERHAVLAHEMGHIAHFHVLKRILWFISFRVFFNPIGYWKMCKAQELQADDYAARHGCSEGLKSVLRKTSGTAPGYPTREERIQRLDHG